MFHFRNKWGSNLRDIQYPFKWPSKVKRRFWQRPIVRFGYINIYTNGLPDHEFKAGYQVHLEPCPNPKSHGYLGYIKIRWEE